MASAYIAWYLFLAGAGSGAFLMGAVVDLALRVRRLPCFVRFAPATDAGLVIGPVLVALSSVFLVLDLGVPSRALSVFVHPTASIIGLGSWAILLFCVTAIAALLLGAFFDTRISRAIEFVAQSVATLCSAVIIVYSGVYFSLPHAVPFLHTAWIPALFVASALATGMATLILAGVARGHRPGMRRALQGLIPLDIVLIVVEAVMLAGFFMHASLGQEFVTCSLDQLVTGRYAGAFWLGVVCLACLVPFAIDVVALKGAGLMPLAAGSISTLAGGLCLRFVLLLAAVRFNLAGMDFLQFWF